MTGRTRSAVRAAAVAAMVAVVVVGVWYASFGTDGAPDLDGPEAPAWADGADGEDVDAALARALAATREQPHGGRFTVVSLLETGPRVTELNVTRHHEALHLVRESDREPWELGRVDGEAFLRSADASLRLGGIAAPLGQLDRLRENYRPVLGDEVVLDTGPARALHLVERGSDVHRESLYLDDRTGLIVRRETFDTDGRPVRVVAYTHLVAEPAPIEVPDRDGPDLREHALVVVDIDELAVVAGGDLPRVLPGGYELLGIAAVDASTPATHLFYGDGLYSFSLFVQEGRLARSAVRDARPLATPEGGVVWRWPGAEPQRVVWSGGGRTFTVLSDAPTDELLEVITGLPVDAPPSMLARLQRGITRVGDWLIPGDGSDP